VTVKSDSRSESASRSEPVESPLLYRLPEAARLLGISLAYLYVLKDAGKIRVRRIGRAARVHRDDLVAFAAGAPTAPLKYGSQPSGPLLGADQQRLAVARINDPPKRRRRKAKTKARPRPQVAQGPTPAPEPEPPALVDQQPPVVEHEPEPPPADEPPAPVDQQRDLAAHYFEGVRLRRRDVDQNEAEARSFESTVRLHRDRTGCSLEDATAAVRDAIATAKEKV
jgi:excisionase family DNA binding protein